MKELFAWILLALVLGLIGYAVWDLPRQDAAGKAWEDAQKCLDAITRREQSRDIYTLIERTKEERAACGAAPEEQ